MTQESTPVRNNETNKYGLTEEEKAEYFATVEGYNVKYLELWESTPYEERVLFLPHCMRHSSECESTVYKFGRRCVQCMKCQLGAITGTAEELGIAYYIVPGGSMLMKILRQNRHTVSMGVACPFELATAMKNLESNGLPMVGVLLVRDGCKDTATEMDDALEMIRARKLQGTAKNKEQMTTSHSREYCR